MAIYIHRLALCESEQVGDGTRIWAFAHVMPGAVIGRDCNICDHTHIGSLAVIGNRVTVKNMALVGDGVSVADDAFIGPCVIFTNDQYPRSPRMPSVAPRYADPDRWRVGNRVERGATLGTGAVILPGVTIGRYAMVGAGAIVTRDVPPHRLVVGNPARPVGWVCVCGRRTEEGRACRSCAAADSGGTALLGDVLPSDMFPSTLAGA